MLSEEEESVYVKFQDLCNDLNLDAQTKETTWTTYLSVKDKYTLEGEQSHWLCCAVYVTCRQANVPTVSPTTSINSGTPHGNYVNLTRLLRTSKLSLVDFFEKSRKWGDMSNLKQEYKSKIERLERNFAVTTVIFKKFEPIFGGIFKDFHRKETPEKPAKRKLSFRTSSDLFEFCWTLFLCVKSSLRISDDLVNAYHLLIACVDLIFYNVVVGGYSNMLTPQFATLGESDGDVICIIHTLCDLYDGVSVEAKTIKEFWLRPKIRTMVEQGLLRGGGGDSLSGLVDEGSYDWNYRRLEKEYEEFVLSEGDFDERMYLSDERQSEFGMDTDNYEDYLSLLDTQPVIRTPTPLSELRHFLPQTPLSLKRGEREEGLSSPIALASQSLSKIQALLHGRGAEASDKLKELLGNDEGLVERMSERVKKLSCIFSENYSVPTPSLPGFHSMINKFRTQLGLTLYYRLLEAVLSLEKKRNPKALLSELLEDDSFHSSIYATSMEIILFSYKSPKRFPWIIDTLGLDPYHFYKVIELIIRAEENLSRDVVKHLSQIEERVLEELVWREESVLWSALSGVEEKGEGIPSCEQVFLPSQIEKTGEEGPKRYAVIKTPSGEKCVPVAVGESNESTLIIQDKNSSQILGVVLPPKHGDRAKKGSSLALFFRKFYHLSFIRFQDLCKNLGVSEELLRKIWTAFQSGITTHLKELLLGRHLDQIIMCSLYVVTKVVSVGKEITFTDIMRCYRLQPQSASHIYRSVLLKNEGERGDLIKFYNAIFIHLMQKYVIRFSSTRNEEERVPLSPVPNLRGTPMSPSIQMTSGQSVFVHPLRTAKTPNSPAKLLYQFQRSPNSTLRAINDMVQLPPLSKLKAVKRILPDESKFVEPPAKILGGGLAKRLQGVIDDQTKTGLLPTSQ